MRGHEESEEINKNRGESRGIGAESIGIVEKNQEHCEECRKRL